MSTFFSGLLSLGTAQRKGKFISRSSDFYFPGGVLSVFYDSFLANYAISYEISHLRFFCL